MITKLNKSFQLMVLILVVLAWPLGFLSAEQSATDWPEEVVTIVFFDDPWCPVCQEAKSFVRDLAEKDPGLELEIYSISQTELIHQTAIERGVEEYNPLMAPIVFVGDQALQFHSFGNRQADQIRSALAGEGVESDDDKYVFSLPFTDRELMVADWSLPIITMVLGSLDGFNVCSLGALILILSLVMVLDSRRLIFFYGSLFILTTVAVYGVLVFVWGQLFQALIGYLNILAYVVGLAALAGSIYFFKEFWRFFRYGPTCQSQESDLAQRATQRVMKVFKDPASQPLALVGAVVTFAAVITLVELPCSIGVPIAFTGILVERGVSLGVYTGYILLYLFFYMLIEMIIFSGAVWSKKLWFAGSRLITWVTFAGAVVLLYLAWYYLSAGLFDLIDYFSGWF